MKCDVDKDWCKRCSVESITCAEKLCDICKMPESKDPMLMDNEEFAEFIKDMQPQYADAWTVMRFESLVNQLMQKFMNPKITDKQLL